MQRLLDYWTNLTPGSYVLWCYLVWYAVVTARYFDASPSLWMTSIGLSLIVGLALVISTSAAGRKPLRIDGWQRMRFFLIPFCVSSFAGLVRGKGFILVFSPRVHDFVDASLLCAGLWTVVTVMRRVRGRQQLPLSEARPATVIPETGRPDPRDRERAEARGRAV